MTLFFKMEEDLNIFENGRRPKFFENGRQHYFLNLKDLEKFIEKIMEPETLKIKTIVVAPLRVT